MAGILRQHPLSPGEWLAVDLGTLRRVRVRASGTSEAILACDGALLSAITGRPQAGDMRARWCKKISAAAECWVCRVEGVRDADADGRRVTIIERLTR